MPPGLAAQLASEPVTGNSTRTRAEISLKSLPGGLSTGRARAWLRHLRPTRQARQARPSLSEAATVAAGRRPPARGTGTEPLAGLGPRGVSLAGLALRLSALCSHVTTALCSHVTIALCSHVTIALCSHATTALCGHVTTALCSHVTTALCSHVTTALCSHVTTALCSHVTTSLEHN
jgi:hypothetical protein